MDVDLLSDGLAPHRLQPDDSEKALAFSPNEVGRFAFEQTAKHNKDFPLYDCDTGSLIYLAVAEIKGYPCYLVEVPGHNFLRWAGLEREMNWDPVLKQSVPDFRYRRISGMRMGKTIVALFQ